MRFHQFFVLAPALLAAAQTSTNGDSSSMSSSVSDQSASSTGGSSTESSSATSGSSSSVISSASMSSSSSGSNSDSMDSQSSGGSDGSNPDLITKTWNGGTATLVTTEGGQIIGTITGGMAEMASVLNGAGGEGLGTLMSSVPPTTFTTDTAEAALPTGNQAEGNNAPVATAAPILAGGVVGAGLMMVGLL